MHEDRSGSEQQPPEYHSAWPASHDGSDDYVAPSDGDKDQARHDVASAAPGDDATQPGAVQPAAGGTDQPGAGRTDQPGAGGTDQPAAGVTDQPMAGSADQPGGDGYEYPTMIYAPPGTYPAGAGEPGAQGGYGSGGPGYGGGSGYGGEPGYSGSGYGGGSVYGGEPGYGGGPAYGGGYGGGSGYQGSYSYGPGGYGPGGPYPPGGSGYGTPGGYGSDDVIGYGDRPPRRGTRIVTYVVVAALAAGVGAGTVLALNHNSGSSSPSVARPGGGFGVQGGGGGFGGQNGGAQAGGNGSDSAKAAAAANKVSPGIVNIISEPRYQNGTLEGTGMILSSNGLVLTNNHVVQGTSKWRVKIPSTGQTFKSVTVLGTDATDDVALLQLNGASGLHPIPRGNSDSVHKGDPVVALGNAEGRNSKPSVVAGRVTALNQSIKATDEGAGTTENLHGMLETNAPIISGDSGGALANLQGQVIGMNTAANSSPSIGGAPGQGGASMGFAIPINTALSIATLISSKQQSSKIQIGLPAFLGVTVASASSGPSTSADPKVQQHQLRSTGRQNGFGGFGGAPPGGSSNGCLSVNAQASVPDRIAPVSSGTLVSGVLCGTPVATAGMTAGAVITSINGQAIGSPASLTKNLTQYHPGTMVSVQWVSPNGQHHTSSLKLAPGPAK